MQQLAMVERAVTNVGSLGSRADAPAQLSSITLVSSLSALKDLEQDWRALEKTCRAPVSVFQTFDWNVTWSEVYANGNNGTELHILTGYDGNRLDFIWPLMKTKAAGLTVLTWLTEPFGQYGDVLCDSKACTRHWITSGLAFLKRMKGIDLLRLRHVRKDSHVAEIADELLVNARMEEGAPYLDLSQYKTEEDYDSRYSSVQRKRRKKIRKGLEQAGPVQFKSLPPGSVADEAMRQAVEEKNKWLAERGRMNRILGCPGHIVFLKNLARRAKDVEVVVTELTAGGKPVSWEIGFRHNKSHFAYITSHRNDMTDLSPGRLHMDLSQRAALNAKMSRFDLMVPNDAHKESWSSSVVPTNDYFYSLSVKGWLFGQVYLKALRPILRHAYYAMQPNLLKFLGLHRFTAEKKTSAQSD